MPDPPDPPTPLRDLYDDLVAALKTTVQEAQQAHELAPENRALVLQRCSEAYSALHQAMSAHRAQQEAEHPALGPYTPPATTAASRLPDRLPTFNPDLKNKHPQALLGLLGLWTLLALAGLLGLLGLWTLLAT